MDLDSISTSGVIGLAFRLFEMGIITKEHTEGLAVELGERSGCQSVDPSDGEPRRYWRIISQEGLLVWQGILVSEEEAIQVNGLELALS